jgi:regulator of sigma E protease
MGETIITSVIAFIVVLGITITIHEFGHFAMAKLLKIKVLVFSLGFGPKLVGFTRGGTEYRLSPIPLGGYVKMAGETYDADREGAPDEFLSHPKWHRFLVAISGPFMNILLAVLIFTYFFIQGVEVPKYEAGPPVVGPVMADSIAKHAGLEKGDRILSVAGNRVDTWKEMEIALGTAPKDSLKIEVQRNGRMLSLHLDSKEIDARSIDPVLPTAIGFLAPSPKIVINTVDRDAPAGIAGLKREDQILSVTRNGKKENDPIQIPEIIAESAGIPLVFEVLRPQKNPESDAGQTPASNNQRGKILQLPVTPIEKNGRGIAGFSFSYFQTETLKYGLGEAFLESIRTNYENVTLTFRIIGRMLVKKADYHTLSGPIGIAQISGEAARTLSIGGFIKFIGMISLQLGVFNLLPIPILDGGVMLLLIIEGIMRRDLSINLKEKIVQVGFVFLILLMGFAVFNDLSKIFDFNRIFG